MSKESIGDLARRGVLVFSDGYRTTRSELGVPGFRIIRVADIRDSSVRSDGPDFVRREFRGKIGSKLGRDGDVLLTTKGTVGRVAVLRSSAEDVVYSPQLCFFRVVEPEVLSSKYLALWFRSTEFTAQSNINSNNTDMAAYLNLRDISRIQVSFPDAKTQNSITQFSDALEGKMAANLNVIQKASQFAAAVLDRGLAADSREVLLGEVAEFHNRRRVPLSSRERQARPGAIPYYGAASRMDFVDEALFNGEYLLVGEDGTVVRDDGRAVTQYIWGQAWVNNHAHVLTGQDFSTELLRLVVERVSVAHIVTGAVQPKISMGSLKSLRVLIPEELSSVDDVARRVAEHVRLLTDENERIAASRDELLPLMMSGKLRVGDAEKVAEEVL